jgi:PAS domain S-box-containing protein
MYEYAQELLEKRHLTFETENIRRDGVVIPVEVSAYLHTEGTRRFVVSSVRDITERKRVEEDLTRQKQFLERILATTPDGFWIFDLGKKITDANAAYSAMTGYSRDELIQMEIGDIDAIENPGETAQRIQRIIENGSETFETKHRRKDGSVFDVEVSASRLNQGDTVYLFAFCRDVSERKKADEALRKSEEELKKAQEITHIGSWYLDIETNHVTWTEELYKMYGFDKDKPVPPYTEHMRLFTPESWNLLSVALAQTRDTGVPYELELQTVRNDGSNGWMWVRGEAVFGENRTIIGLWGAAQDITDRKQVEKEIQKQLSEKETLLREVHHRVKNNIAMIESLLSLQSGDSVSAEVRAALQETISRVQSIRVLYEKLLISAELNEISMNDYVESLLDALVMVFDPQRTITVKTRIADIVIPSETAVSIGIVINELLTNAFKYAFTDRDGGLVSVSLDQSEHAVTLVIRDDGAGIDEAILERPSPGFGLTIVTMLVEQLQGTLRFTNDNGTQVTLEIPIGSGDARLTAVT